MCGYRKSKCIGQVDLFTVARMHEENDRVSCSLLIDFFSSIKKYVKIVFCSFSNWESRLVELFELNSEDENQPSPFRGRRIDKNGKIVEFKMSFDELSLYEKVKVVYALCEMRFYREDKLKEINQIEEDELRVEPLGQDSEGCLYWYVMKK